MNIQNSNVKICQSDIQIQSQKMIFFLESWNIEYLSGEYSTFNIKYQSGRDLIIQTKK